MLFKNLIKRNLSFETYKIINSKNTCLYKFIGQSLLIDKGKYVNITDRKECFNTNQFPDFENLINCGFATLTFTTDEGTFENRFTLLSNNTTTSIVNTDKQGVTETTNNYTLSGILTTEDNPGVTIKKNGNKAIKVIKK